MRQAWPQKRRGAPRKNTTKGLASATGAAHTRQADTRASMGTTGVGGKDRNCYESRVPSLVRFRLRSLARRLGAGRPVVAVVAIVVIAAALLGLVVAASAIAADDALEADRVYDRVFWLGAIAAVVWGYTSFEVLFRAPDRRFLASLPIGGGARFTDLFVRAIVLHVPLILPAMAYAIGLARAGQPGLAGYAALSIGALFVAGLPLSMALHMWAGRSLLANAGELKRWLAGAAFAEEAALLVYAPALGLLVTLGLGIVADFAWRGVFVQGRSGALVPLVGGALAIGVGSFVAGRRIAEGALHAIMPRFTEVDLPLPYTEDGLPKTTPGESLARALPARARPYFMRDLRQLRRRHRIDRILLWVFAASLVRVLHAGHGPASPLVAALLALVFVNGLFFASAFRVHGPELASSALERTLPIARAPERIGRLAASLIHPLWTVAIAAVAVATTGQVIAAVATLGLGLALVVTMALATEALAGWDARTAWPWRAAVIALVGLVGGWL